MRSVPEERTLGRARLRSLLLVALVAVLVAVAAACGGSDSVTETATEESSTATEARTDASARAIELAELLPSADAIADLGDGSLTELGDADTVVDQLYSEGDPARDAAVERFREGGYDLGVVRDQLRFGQGEGPQLVRSYVIGFATPQAAQTEVSESVAEVKRSSSAPSTDVPVDGIPGAEAVLLEVDQTPGEIGTVFFVTFSSGRFLFGIQSFAEGGEDVREAATLAAARDAFVAAS